MTCDGGLTANGVILAHANDNIILINRDYSSRGGANHDGLHLFASHDPICGIIVTENSNFLLFRVTLHDLGALPHQHAAVISAEHATSWC